MTQRRGDAEEAPKCSQCGADLARVGVTANRTETIVYGPPATEPALQVLRVIREPFFFNVRCRQCYAPVPGEFIEVLKIA